jgi:hypothetical protein
VLNLVELLAEQPRRSASGPGDLVPAVCLQAAAVVGQIVQVDVQRGDGAWVVMRDCPAQPGQEQRGVMRRVVGGMLPAARVGGRAAAGLRLSGLVTTWMNWA